ncbi:MAG TPA: glycogen synthase GlgA [Kiritimatiellia bacterium]|nr:glycogen synthase GlgA [Kiritimatiellia bacterium]
MKIAFVSSEITPYASTGGLADVCRSLPNALVGLGHDVTCIMPMYRRVLESSWSIEDTGIRLSIPVGFHNYRADIWKVRSDRQPNIYFIRRDEFFDRSQLYNLPDRDYDDNFERFVFFQKAVIAFIDHMNRPFDIVHAHDWQTGLMPLYLKYGMKGEGRKCREKTVFTIHNLAFQGIFNGDDYSYSNLPFSCFSVDVLEYYGNISCMKSGITSSDMVTTVSETYAREIQTEEWGCGLQGVLANVKDRLRGIVNGIDMDEWNPDKDKNIASNYNSENMDGKSVCKADLIRRMKLKISPDAPLIGMVTRLTVQKGIALVHQVIPEIMEKTNAGLVVLGSGSDEYQEMVTSWVTKWPGRVVVKLGFDIKLAHRIEAGADIFLMPSKYEPCGLNQLYSMRYGTIPIVHNVGGLADTVVDVTKNPGQGYGYKFHTFTKEALAEAIHGSIKDFANKKQWIALQKRAMNQDFSWFNSARQYEELYLSLIS